MSMRFKLKKSALLTGVLSAGLLASGIGFAPVYAADHRDSATIDGFPEGDITDVYAFVDPARPSNVILEMVVNPFLSPSEGPSARFASDFLYQFKIDNNQGNGVLEDRVVQITFSEGRGAQTYSVRMGTPSNRGPNNNRVLGGGVICQDAPVFLGNSYSAPMSSFIRNSGNNTCFAGLVDDAFQTDVGHVGFRIGLNPNPAENAINHTQDFFRFPTGGLIGGLRGHSLRADGTSGVDGFGGHNTTVIAVSIPKSALVGTGGNGGIGNVSTSDPSDANLIGVWGTVSHPTRLNFNTNGEFVPTAAFNQFERMGQQLMNTVFIFGQVPGPPGTPGGAPRTVTPLTRAQLGIPGSGAVTTAEIKDRYNQLGPESDVALFSRYAPDALTTAGTPNDGCDGIIGGLLCGILGNALGGNTVQGRATLLTLLGVNSLAINGAPLLLPQIGLSNNSNINLLRQLFFPDYLRLNVNQAPDGIRGGAAASGNSSATLSVGKWGLQNGRRPADDVTDVVLRLGRELVDVKFPATFVLPGLFDVVPGAGPQGNRHTFQCDALNVNVLSSNGNALGNILTGVGGLVGGQSDNLLGLISLDVLQPCEDARIFAVLQGTDFIERLPTDIINVANQISYERALPSNFPYLGLNPVPSQPGSHDYPPQTDFVLGGGLL